MIQELPTYRKGSYWVVEIDVGDHDVHKFHVKGEAPSFEAWEDEEGTKVKFHDETFKINGFLIESMPGHDYIVILS